MIYRQTPFQFPSAVTGKSEFMRLDKFISQQLEVSRAIAGREIRGRKITINGEVVRDTAYKVLPDDAVEYDGNPLTCSRARAISC